MYNLLLKILKPFIKIIGKIHSPFSHKKITGEHYYKIRDSISIGDVFLTKTRGELSNLINPTAIKHGGVYVGKILDDKVCYVLEAVGKGVVLTDLVSFMTSKDVFVITAPRFLRTSRDEFETQFQLGASKLVGVKYDYGFSFGKDKLYCFEAVAECFKYVYPEIQLKVNEIVKGKRIYDEETFLDENLFITVFDSRKRDF